jgi:hypothetical protein
MVRRTDWVLGMIGLGGVNYDQRVRIPESGTMPAGSISSRQRRFLRISVRGLIVLVLAFGVGFGWFVRSARIKRDAVAAITKADGSFQYDWEWSNGKRVFGGGTSVAAMAH